MAVDEWANWIAAIRDGDEQASNEFWTKYAQPLIQLAENNLQQRLQQRIDPEDVVQSAFRTALRRLQAGQFEVNSADELWKLLCAITLNKTRQQARRHHQQMRSVANEVPVQAAHSIANSSEPTPSDALYLIELVERLLDQAKDDEHRQVLQLKLDGHTQVEIAEKLDRSERTVRRICNQLKADFIKLLDS